jgi:hypothetical protein
MFTDYVHAVHRSDTPHRWEREQMFENRLHKIKEIDPALYKDIQSIGKMIADGKSTPEQLGNAIGAALKSAWDRIADGKGGSPNDLTDPITAAMSGLLISAQGSFKGNRSEISERTKALLAGAEAAINPDPKNPGHALGGDMADPVKAQQFYGLFTQADETGHGLNLQPHASFLPPVKPGLPEEPAFKVQLFKTKKEQPT